MPLSVKNKTVSNIQRSEYVVSLASFSTATTAPTYVFRTEGIISSLLLVKVLRIGIGLTNNIAGFFNVQLQRLSTNLTGGTASTSPLVSIDSTNPVAFNTNTVTYTTNNTGGGNIAGVIRSIQFIVHPPTSITHAAQGEYIFDFTGGRGQNLILRGSSEFLAITLSGPSANAPTMVVWMEWLEV